VSYRNASLGLSAVVAVVSSRSGQPVGRTLMDTYLPKQKKINSLKNEGDTFSSPPPPSVTLWRPLATLGDTFASTPASKNRFRNIPTRNRATCASGFGVPPPPSPPPKLAKKKKFQKKFRTRPPSPPPIDWKSTGAIGKNITE
jgi:hypothetical protein